MNHVNTQDLQGYLNWNTLAFQALMVAETWFNEITMYSYIASVMNFHKDSIYATDPDQFFYGYQLQDELIENKEWLENRQRKYKDKNYFCRILVSGKEFKDSHYQVLVFNRKKREVTVIEYTSVEGLDAQQIKLIKTVLYSIGWVTTVKATRVNRATVKGKRAMKSKKDNHWYYHHHNYFIKIGDGLIALPECGPFACLAYKRVMENKDTFFIPHQIKFDNTFFEIDVDGIRWAMIKSFRKILGSYIDAEMEINMLAWKGDKSIQKSEIEKWKLSIDYTKRLLDLSDENFQAAILPEETQVCDCFDKEKKTKNYFIPSCCGRMYHADCFLKYLWLQITEGQNFSVCKFCKPSETDVLCGIINTEFIGIDNILEWKPNTKLDCPQFLELISLDDLHR